jgi:hypothetical protein
MRRKQLVSISALTVKTIGTVGTPISFLAGRTVKPATIADRNPLYRARTTAALFAAPVIDIQMMLKLAALVVSVAVVRKRRAAPANRIGD